MLLERSKSPGHNLRQYEKYKIKNVQKCVSRSFTLWHFPIVTVLVKYIHTIFKPNEAIHFHLDMLQHYTYLLH